ncbi:YoaK family protein [Orbaceae bacterium ac157xtp]
MPLHERLEIGILLAVIGGFLDAYSFLCYDGVFANTQTGNMVLLGITLFNGDFANFFDYLIPIIAFSIGIIITEFLLKFFVGTFFIWVLITEIFILFIIAFLPESMPHIVVTAAISFMCSIQIGSFRKICGAPYTSTMCTGNLRSAMGLLFTSITNKDRDALIQCLRYLVIILFFCIGSAIGAMLINWINRLSILFCCLLLCIFLAIFIKDLLYLKRKQRTFNAILGKDV